MLGLLFLNPSLRTLASFQAAMAHLGGASFVITPGQGTWQLETRLNAVMDGAAAEHIREGIPVLASYCDALGVRAFAEGKNLESDLSESLFRQIDALCDSPLINLESADQPSLPGARRLAHPGRARNAHAARKFVLSWVYHPRALPLAVPAGHPAHGRDARHGGGRGAARRVRAAARDHGQGAPRRERVRRLGHRDLRPRGGAQGRAAWSMPRNGAAPRITATPRRMRACAPGSRIGACAESWFAAAAPGAKLMHCLPVRRNVAVADEILDGPRAVVRLEAFNRLIVQTAVLHRMLA